MQRPGVAAFFEAVTLNVQGLSHPHKFQAILDWAADSPAQVFFLQECHRAECVWQWAESATGAKPCWRGLWFYTPGTGHSQGCLALFKPSTILVACSQVHLQVAGAQGRVLRVDAELAGRPASLVCVYAPAQASQRATFFSSCLPACLPLASDRRLVIMGGDFNCILSPEDKVGTPRVGNTAHPVGWLGSRGQGAQQLQELVTERGLVDAWRHLRPGTRDFTHFSTPWQTGGRLDRWYIPAELVEWQLDSSILGLKPVHTDHAAVSLAVCPPNLPLTAPAPWQLHPAYLDDPDMMDRLQSFLLREAASHAAQMSSLPSPLPRDLHRARWAHIKQGLALQAQRCIRDRRRAQRALQQARERAAHAARTHLVQQLLEVEQLREAALQAAVVVGEATALVGVTDRAEAAQRSMQASAVLDQVYGDSSSFYFYHRQQSAHTPTLITSLHLPDLPDQVADLTTTHGVQAACHAFQSHFSAASPLGVYAAKPVVPAARATLLASLTSRLTPTQADSSEGPGGDPMLSEEELGRALQGCAHSKAPGKDGLPMEVYDRLWPLLRPPLMAMLREALADTSSPAPLAEFLTGLVTLVPKAGKPRDQVSGYRPITLLNCDVRLVARALEDRLQRPLDLLVSPSQSAFILGRDIGDNVQFHLSLLEYLRQRGSPAWLLLLDLAGAYDNVSWDLLQATMEAMGFRQDGHVRWAQILHRGATSQVLVNGHLTNSFPLESGLLQGSGASPLYWCIVLQPLVSYLSSLQLAGRLNTPSIPISPLASHMATLQPTMPSKEYADDITITVLDRVKDGAVVVEALEVFRAAGGPALSMGKSQALPCAQQELQQGQHGWAGGGAGAHELGPGEADGRLELGAGGGEPRGGEEHGRRERQQQARGPKPLSESGGPSTGIPATREGVPVRHLGVPLGAVCDGVSSEAAFGGSAAAMTAASLSWTPQGLNLLCNRVHGSGEAQPLFTRSMPGSKKLGNGLAGKSQASKAQSDSSESRPRPECPGVEQAAMAMEALQTTDPKVRVCLQQLQELVHVVVPTTKQRKQVLCTVLVGTPATRLKLSQSLKHEALTNWLMLKTACACALSTWFQKLEVGAQDNTVSSLTQSPAAGGSATSMGPSGGTASGAITARLPPLVSPHHHSRPAAPAGAVAAPEPTVGQLQMEMVSLQSKLQTEQVAVIKLRARVAQLEPLEHTRLMRERFTSATAQLQTASGDLVRVTARLQELLSLPFLTAEQAEEQAKASAMHTSLRRDIARLTAEVNSCATAATATGAAELDAAANELAAAQRQTQLERTLRERAQEELRTGNAHNQARCRELEGQIESLKHNYNVVQGDKAALQNKLNSFESRLRNARTILSQFPGGVEAMLNKHLHELSAPEQARAQKASLHRNFNENVLFSFMATSEAAGANPSLPLAEGAPGPSNAVPPLPPPITEDEELWQEDAFTADELEAGPGLYMGPKEHEAVQAWFATGPANRLRHYLEYAASMKLGDLANHPNWGPSACGLHFHEWAQCVKPLFAEKVSTKDVVEQTPSLPAVPQQTQDTRPLSIKPKHPPPFSGADKQIWEDFKFQFESYLDTCRVPKQDWPDHVLNMLEGKALQAWLAVAQPMRALGTKPTWENLADTMAKSFVHINIPVEARKALYSIKQQTRTSEYLRHFRLLLARVTEPKPADADLLNFYYTGLKQTLRDQCKLNPKTGRFWDNFEELADFTLQIDLHSRIASALQAHLPVRTVAVVPVAAAAAAAPEAEAVPVDVEIIPVSTTTTTRTTTVEAVVAAVAAARDGAVMITAPDNPGQQDI
ncbi:hypothetical protein QJQ45_012481 [Haematococcus lacustris]|nr:hypothetical protein QJQ45_012481 [Haematococcus lacustris]